MPDRDYASEALARIPGTPEHQAAQRTARKSANGADLAGNGPHTDQAKPYPPNAFKPRSPPHAPWSYHDGTEPAATAQLVKNILPETSTGLIAGQWGTYKTTVALDISVSVMTGIPF